jgi:hypothetical protein
MSLIIIVVAAVYATKTKVKFLPVKGSHRQTLFPARQTNNFI